MLSGRPAAASNTRNDSLGVYSLFGLTIASGIPLPCPRCPGGKEADVELLDTTQEHLAKLCRGTPIYVSDDGYWQDTLFGDGTARVHWREHFEFVVTGDGRRVFWHRAEGVPDEVLFTYLLGHVLSYCLLARGIEPLHATSVVVNGKAIAFLGDSGDGKSTLAAAFLAKGFSLLTDDVLVLKFYSKQVTALPSLARIKLLPEAADAFLQGRRSMAMNRFSRKMVFTLDTEHHSAPAPLEALYLIARQPSAPPIGLRPLVGPDAFLPVIRNTFNDSVLCSERIKRQFAFATELVRRVPVKLLSCSKGLELLPAVVDAIVADVCEGARHG